MHWSICLPFAEQSQSDEIKPAEDDNEITKNDEVAETGDNIEDDEPIEEDKPEERQNDRKCEWSWILNQGYSPSHTPLSKSYM